MTMHIGIAGPIATADIAGHLYSDGTIRPAGYVGAPLMGVLIGELLRAGHRVSAYTTDSSLSGDAGEVVLRGDRLTVRYCPSRPHAWRFQSGHPGRAVDGFACERAGLAAAMRKDHPDILHAHWTYEFALAALDTGLPHLITCHDDPLVILRQSRSPYRAMRYLMARRVFPRARRLTAVSTYLRQGMGRYTDMPMTVVPNPLAEYVQAQGRVRVRPEGRRIAMVGNGWSRFKNPQPALVAFARFRLGHPEAELHCFGADFGPGETAQLWASSRGLDLGIQFHGMRPHRDLIRHLSKLDLLLHPAREESFGVVVAEAMALGLPVVAGRASGAVPWVVGQGELSDPLPGALVDVNSPESLLAGIESAFDDSYGARSSAGVARARDAFSVSAVARAYLDEYANVLGNAPLSRAMSPIQVGGMA